MLRLDSERLSPFLDDRFRTATVRRAVDAHRVLLNGTGPGGEFLGWRRLLRNPDVDLLAEIAATAGEIRAEADVLVCIGIGGSYLGSKAVIEALSPSLRPPPVSRDAGRNTSLRRPEIVFAGHHMSGAYVRELLAYLEGRSVYVNVISKSGTTLEPALAFRFIREWMERTFDDVERRIIVTTDPSDGALNALQRVRGYRKFVIPRDVGGRFSVLTPVGLLPIASAGIDVQELFQGAVVAYESFERNEENLAVQYAADRFAIHEKGFAIDLFAVFEPRLAGIGQWWQQLFGESEGKAGKGLFPAVVQYSTDLHSLGQYVQDGKRALVETFLIPEDDDGELALPYADTDVDGLSDIAGMTMTEINRAAYEGTARAHAAGGVPNMTLWIDRVTPETIGEVIYFFEHAVAVSGYLLDVNPFDQPGVEAYKQAMFALLGRT